MRPKHRRTKLKKHEKQVYPTGYYEKLLWFIVSDSVESEDKNEITDRYLRAWDDIWHSKITTGKPGRPATNASQDLRKMNALINNKPGLKPNTAAKQIAANASFPSDEARNNFVRILVRRYNSVCKDKAVLPEKDEKFVLMSELSPVDLNVLASDGVEFWKLQEPLFLTAFLSDIEKELKT